MIEQPDTQDYDELLRIWELAVRSTHHFLTENDIELYMLRGSTGRIAAFLGLSEDNIEMLFVHPDEQGRGYGKCLIDFAVHEKRIYKVDVNEQNEKAFHFYQNRGFEVVGRDAVDGMGKPFPILHMQLSDKKSV